MKIANHVRLLQSRSLPHQMIPLAAFFGEGTQATHLSLGQVLVRTVVIFFSALLVVRFADKRFFAKKTAFDVILGLILASMMSRAINGSEKLVPTIAAGFLMASLHRFLGWLACKVPQLGNFIKGHSTTLVKDGLVD